MSGETSKQRKLCGLCSYNESKYCCPRCNVFYCSIDCYKSEKHLECSEDFYRDCVNQELAGNHTDNESRKKMMEILKRMQKSGLDESENIEEVMNELDDEDVGVESQDSDDEQFLDLADRVQGINLDDADALWSALTEDERNEFEALLTQGDMGNIIPQWEPWWMYKDKKKLIQDAEEKNTDNLKDKCPALVTVPEFSTLSSVQPSPALKFNITNILASYAFTTRYFNGDLDPMETISYLLSICGNLYYNTNYEDPSIAVEAVVQSCLKCDLIQTDEVSLETMKHDTALIIKGPSTKNKAFYVKAALSHLHSLMSETINNIKCKKTIEKQKSKDKKDFTNKFKDHTTEHLPKLETGVLKKCLKKIEFYIAYVESYGLEYMHII